MVDHKDTYDVAKKLLKLNRNTNNDWSMVSFIHNGSEITTSENQKHKIQSNIFKVTASFLTFNQHTIRLTQGHWSCTPTHYKTAIFIATPMKKIYLVFVNLLTEKLWV